MAFRDDARLSRLSFDNNYAGYLEVLHVENERFGGEPTAVRCTQIVSMYQAVGGGWADEADKSVPQPQLAAPAAATPSAAAR